MRKGVLLVGISSVSYGLMPLLTTEFYRMGFSVTSASFWRFFPIVPILFVICRCRQIDMRMGFRRLMGLCLTVGVPSGTTMLLLNMAYASMDVGVATTLHFLYPVVVSVLSAVVFHDKITPSVKWSVILIAVGMLVLSGGLSLDGDAWAAVCAMGSAFTYAIYLLRLDHGGYARLNPIVTTMYIAVSNSVLMFVVHILGSPIQMPGTVPSAFVALGMSLLSLVALFCLSLGSRDLMPHYVAVFGLLEPVTSMLCAALMLGEEITVSKIIGVAIIMFAVFLVASEGNALRMSAFRSFCDRRTRRSSFFGHC